MLLIEGKQLCWKCLLLLSSTITTYTLDINIDSLSRVLPGHSSNQDGAITQWFSQISKTYRDTASQSTSLVNFDLSELSKTTANLLTSRLFQPRRDALQNTVIKAQNYAAKFDWSENISVDTEYHESTSFEVEDYSKDDKNNGIDHFKKPVNFTFSSVFIPVERYSKEPDLLLNLNWTDKLEEYFKENYEKSTQTDDYDDFLWQYFGSQAGFVRMYPAMQWPNRTGVDMYDARRRPWYNQGSSVHKDVLIMMDTSGSTVGQTLYLMQVTVQKILDSLGEDDYFQVANFSNYAFMDDSKWDTQLKPPSFFSFLQATEFNRRHVMKYVNNLTKPENQANFTVALEYAFKTFNKLEKERERLKSGLGANCAKIIIILTDGGIEQPEVLIHKNDPNKEKYRIFTFAMGQAPTPLDAVKWLACNYRGYYTQISKIGNVYSGVDKYTRHLSRILSGDISKPDEYVPSKLSTAYIDNWGLGMMTSLTMPVINVTDPTRQNLLGVMAIDVSLEEFNQYVQHHKLGGLGYVIVVNHNGHLIIHEDLVSQQDWNTVPPTVDLIDIERVTDQTGHDRINEVRAALLEDEPTLHKDASRVGEVYKNEENPAYYEEYDKTYQTVRITNTAYRLALVIPKDKTKYLHVGPDKNVTENIGVLSELMKQYNVTMPRWRYCDKMYKLSNSSVLDGFIKLIKNSSITCDKELINHFMMDARVINSSQLFNLAVNEENVLSVSITTAGGLTAVYPSSSADYLYPIHEPFIKPATKRALHHTDEVFYVPTYIKSAFKIPENGTHPPIFLYKAVTDGSEYDYVYSVVGAEIASEEIIDALSDLTDSDDNYLCKGENSLCYLLDDGGFVVARNQKNNETEEESHIGRWVGDIDPSIMYALYDQSNPSNSVYNRHKFIDYQARCVESWSNLPSSASRMFKLTSVISILESIIVQMTTFFSLFSSGFLSQEIPFVNSLPYGHRYVMCTNISYQYYFNEQLRDNFTLHQLNINTNDCNRSIMVMRIDGTNLLLVVASSSDIMCSELTSLPQSPRQLDIEEIVEEDESVRWRHTRKRRRPTQCYDKDKEGNVYTCAGCSLSINSVLLLTLLVTLKLLRHIV